MESEPVGVITMAITYKMKNRMWKDSEADLDFLNFNYLAEQVVEISKDDNLSPATIGVYGDWGSGKSSLFEIIYRVINNLSCLLNRGKRRKTADDLYYVRDLYAELYYVVNGQLARISCLGDKVEFQMGKEASVLFSKYTSRKGTLIKVRRA